MKTLADMNNGEIFTVRRFGPMWLRRGAETTVTVAKHGVGYVDEPAFYVDSETGNGEWITEYKKLPPTTRVTVISQQVA